MSRRFLQRAEEAAPPPPLNAAALEALALRYVGRYATTRARLATYLRRKLIMRGWEGDTPPPVAAIVARLADLRYIDDAAFAVARGGALLRRGYGERRIGQALRAAGVEEPEAAEARATARDGALAAALAFARRKRIGPFATAAPDRAGRDKAFAALMRAGHGTTLARRIVEAAPGTDIGEE